MSAGDVLGLGATYELMETGVVRFTMVNDVITVTGSDALSYLDGQCTQDLRAIVPGESSETLVLSPQGKVDSYAQVVLSNPEELRLIVDEGFGTQLLDRLMRFKLRVKAELVLEQVPVTIFRGPGCRQVKEALPENVLAVDPRWPGRLGLDLFVSDLEIVNEIREGDGAGLEVARIEAGIPALGKELTDKTIPQEAGITARTVSFTKGCYTGQELVARIDARGDNVPRRLRGLVISDRAHLGDVLPGDDFFVAEISKGAVTSVSFSPRVGRLVALGYARRDVVIPSEVEVRGATGTFAAEIVPLPLVGQEDSELA